VARLYFRVYGQTLLMSRRQVYADGAGVAPYALIASVRARQLSFPVKESGCLEACGMGTMIAIDYHDGSA
jgi:hypothetical protein